MSNILHARDDAAQDENLAGGKGASLAKLAGMDVPVPEFFIISTRAFPAGDTDGEFDAQLVNELRAAYADMGEPVVAVRSSAVGEDAFGASHAGVYDTVLDVQGMDALLDAIKHCWASYGTDIAGSYRQDKIVSDEGGMAVVVQQYIPADWAGVCFTADPVRERLTRMTMNAWPGIGEDVVSGNVTPEELTLDRDTGRILRREAGEREIEVPVELAQQVWSLSAHIADVLQFPQDIEWVAANGTVSILQSRPITTLAAMQYSRYLEPWRDTPADAEDEEQVWSRVYADEIWSSPVSPLFYHVQNLSPIFEAWRAHHHDPRPLPPVIFKYYKAAAYVNLEVLKQTYEYHPRVARTRALLSFFPETMREEVRQSPFRWWGRLRRFLKLELQDRKTRSLRHNHQYLQTLWPDFMRRTDPWFDLDLDEMDLAKLRDHYQEVMNEYALVGPPCEYAVLYHATDLTFLLTGLLDRWFGEGEILYSKLSSGLEGSQAVHEADWVWQIAQQIRRLDPPDLETIREADWSQLHKDLSDSPALAPIIESIEKFWLAHRHRGASYKDLIYPRWGEQPDALLALIKSYLNGDSPRPKEVNARQAEIRRQTQAELLAALSGPLAPIRRAFLRWLMHYNEIYMLVRDDHRYYFDRNWYELRRIYLSYGRRLVKGGILADVDDIFFLGTDEIDAGLENRLSAKEASLRVSVRRNEWWNTRSHQPPKFLQGYVPMDDTLHHTASEGALSGAGASAGIVEGQARVVYSVEEMANLLDNEIVVTRQTDPSWTPYFPRMGGLVLETGGALAHGTSLCREYGLPCVSAVDNATEQIPPGSRIRIDGSRGTVTIIQSPGQSS